MSFDKLSSGLVSFACTGSPVSPKNVCRNGKWVTDKKYASPQMFGGVQIDACVVTKCSKGSIDLQSLDPSFQACMTKCPHGVEVDLEETRQWYKSDAMARKDQVLCRGGAATKSTKVSASK